MNRVILIDGFPFALILGNDVYLPPMTVGKGRGGTTEREFDLGIFAPYFSVLDGEYNLSVQVYPRLNFFLARVGTFTRDTLKLPEFEIQDTGEIAIEPRNKAKTNTIRADINGIDTLLLAFPDTELTGDFTLNMIYPLLSNIIRTEVGMPLLNFTLPPEEAIAFGFENIWHGFMVGDKTYLPGTIVNSLAFESKDLVIGSNTQTVLKPDIEFPFEEIGFSRENFGALWHGASLDKKPLSLLHFSGKIVGLAWVNEEKKKISFPKIWIRKVPIAEMILCSQELGLRPQFYVGEIYDPIHSLIYGKFEGDWIRNAVREMKSSVFPVSLPSFTIEPKSVYGTEVIFYRDFGYKEYREDPTKTIFSHMLYRCERGLLNHAFIQGNLPIGASISLLRKEEMRSYFPRDCPPELVELILEFFCDAFVDEMREWWQANDIDLVDQDFVESLRDKPIKERIFAAIVASLDNKRFVLAALSEF
jgi:hypothetical protein